MNAPNIQQKFRHNPDKLSHHQQSSLQFISGFQTTTSALCQPEEELDQQVSQADFSLILKLSDNQWSQTSLSTANTETPA